MLALVERLVEWIAPAYSHAGYVIVAAGAIVTRDVPSEHVVTGVNVHTPAERWQGKRLRDLIGYWTTRRQPGGW